MEKILLSAGIDIGTTTTQMVFSRLLVRNTGSHGHIPRFEIESREILYRSRIHFTPYRSGELIDGTKIHLLLLNEYACAGIRPDQISAGAVIMTGEASRKKNAQPVLNAISDIAGNFVVAAAGPDLESVLAGKGSGASSLSKKEQLRVTNLDIGGGTTNIACFKDGRLVDTACYDIGARLIRLEEGRITHLSPKLIPFMASRGLTIGCGDQLPEEKAREVCDWMVELLEQAVGLSPPTPSLLAFETNHALQWSEAPDIFTFSGGVADLIHSRTCDSFAFGDLGVLMGKSLLNSRFFTSGKARLAKETLRATVIGAGNESMTVSGSTIEHRNIRFPLKNLPVIRLPLEEAGDIPFLADTIRKQAERFTDESGGYCGAFSFSGLSCPTFRQIEDLAGALALGCSNRPVHKPLILILREDHAKALGQALVRRLGKECPLLCLDGIECETGDYVDIGCPITQNSVLPVVVKTLLFSNEDRK